MRLPGSLMSDDKLEASLVFGSVSSEMQRALRIKEPAMEEFMKYSAGEALKKAVHGRSRVLKHFLPGEVVYVYRKPLPRRRDSQVGGRPAWCGPGTVILTEGRNVWVSMREELWKCAGEQIRNATPEEEEAMSLLREEFKELKESMGRKESKRAFKDISNWAMPPEESDEVMEPAGVRRRLNQEMEQPDVEEIPGSIEYTPEVSQVGEESSHEEPEMERQVSEEVMEEAIRSVVHNEQLDGTLPGKDVEQAYQPIRGKLENIRFRPYEDEFYVTEFGEAPEEEEIENEEDVWRVDEERGKVFRIDRVPRERVFKPLEKECPVRLKELVSSRRTVRLFEDGSRWVTQGDWRERDSEPENLGPPRKWIGYTEFTLKKKTLMKPSHAWMVKKSSDEVLEDEIPKEEWPNGRRLKAPVPSEFLQRRSPWRCKGS